MIKLLTIARRYVAPETEFPHWACTAILSPGSGVERMGKMPAQNGNVLRCGVLFAPSFLLTHGNCSVPIPREADVIQRQQFMRSAHEGN